VLDVYISIVIFVHCVVTGAFFLAGANKGSQDQRVAGVCGE